jgi:hypothetical protein
LPIAACTQGVLLAALALLPFHPPATGAMVLLPLDGARPGQTLAWALASDARLIAAGPYPGSIVVFGSRARLLGPALDHFTLILASSGAECSPPPKETDNA